MKVGYPIGVVRVVYRENHIAEIGRVAVLKEYRNYGYGTLLVRHMIKIIKANSKVNLIRIFVESEMVEFYKKFGFIENGEVFIDGEPYTSMVIKVIELRL